MLPYDFVLSSVLMSHILPSTWDALKSQQTWETSGFISQGQEEPFQSTRTKAEQASLKTFPLLFWIFILGNTEQDKADWRYTTNATDIEVCPSLYSLCIKYSGEGLEQLNQLVVIYMPKGEAEMWEVPGENTETEVVVCWDAHSDQTPKLTTVRDCSMKS